MQVMSLSPQERERLETEISVLRTLVDDARDRSDDILLQVATAMLEERLTYLSAHAH
jgi:hypothetical protein